MPSIKLGNLSQLTCIVQVDPPKTKTTSQEEQYSCSALIIDAKRGYILTSGGLFCHLFSSSNQRMPLLASNFSSDYHINVIWEKWSKKTGISHQLVSSRGDLVGIWSCSKLADSLRKLFKSRDGWEFQQEITYSEDGSDMPVKDIGMMKARGEGLDDDINWLSSFALVKVDKLMTADQQRFNLLSTRGISAGTPVTVLGTPFGSLHPATFANSFSGGVVTNVTGKDDVVILTDARCLPGMEGAAVFVGMQPNEIPMLIGIVVAPMCWKANQWVGLSVACSITEILGSMFSQLSHTIKYLQGMYKEVHDGSPRETRKCHNFLASVILIKVGAAWGSGVIIDSKKKLILTCRHVVQDAVSKRCKVHVRVNPGRSNSWHLGSVVFITSAQSVVDMAIVQLTNFQDTDHPLEQIAITKDTYEGEPLFAVGFPLFGPETCMSASVTSGHVSKVITFRGEPVMLQTSCGVHPGSSGGALVSQRTGQLVGIMANNCRDDNNSVTIPHLNFSIPSKVFHTPIQKYVQTKDLRFLESLNILDEEVEALWKLQNSVRGSSLTTKSKL